MPDDLERNPVDATDHIDLTQLVAHNASVRAHATVGAVYKSFEQHHQEIVAVVDGERLVGMCSRGQIGFLLGARYGFAIYSQHPITDHLLANCLMIPIGTPLLHVLDLALSREGEEFYEDVALVDDDQQFLGFMAVPTLAQQQSRLLSEKVRLAIQQQEELAATNADLFRGMSELRQSQGRYEILMENSALGVALLNRHGEIEAQNQRVGRMLGGLPRPDATPLPNLTALVVPTERARFLQTLHQEDERQQSAPRHAEFNLHLFDHGNRLFRFHFSRIPETGQICVCLDDITEQRILERQLAQREKAALLESLVGGIAHEINNHLTPIIGYSDLLLSDAEEGTEPAQLVSYCQIIRSSALESGKIIRQLLQVSKPVARELAGCDLNDLVEESLKLVQFRLKELGIEPALRRASSPAPVMVDAGQVKQTIVNLLINALDAMECATSRKLTIEVSEEAHRAILSISDTGHGIAPENLNRIFDPFFTTKGPARGNGLGLSVCFNLIKQHGGEIHVLSEPGQGATFRVVLPIHEMPLKPARPVVDPKSQMSITGARARVLVVDDEEFVTGMVQEILRTKLGLSVEWAFNGHQAIERLQQAPFDLVVSDIRMPGMNGVQFYEWVTTHIPRLRNRFLFITGDAGGVELTTQVEALGAPILRKPFTVQDLLAHSQTLLRSPAEDAPARLRAM
jgi:two-component system NtrC family sensor kinase